MFNRFFLITFLSISWVYAAAPSAPTDVKVRAANAKVDVSWTAPTDTSGLLVTSYMATAAPGGQSCTTTGNPADANCTITGLTNDTAYTVSVTATTADGTSVASSTVSFTPLSGVEDVNLIGTYGRVKKAAGVTGGINASNVDTLYNYNWGQAPGDGDMVSADGTLFDASAGTTTSSTLNCSSSWSFQQVLCDEDSGNGTTPGKNEKNRIYKPSQAAGITWSSAYQPGYVIIDLQAVRTFTTLRIFQMFSDGKISATRLSVSNATGDTWPTRTDGSWSVLVDKERASPGNQDGNYVTCPSIYDFGATKGRYLLLEAWNDGGFGSTGYIEIGGAKLFFENDLASCDDSCPPAAPKDVTATAGSGSAAISWTPPESSNLTSYSIQRSSDNGSSWSAAATNPATISEDATSAQVTGLANATSYVFRVAAINPAGTSTWSLNSNSITTNANLPNPPANVSAAISGTTATISWSSVANATSYTVFGLPSGSCTATHPTVTCNVTGLTPGLSYTFTVTTTNGDGTSGASDPSNSVSPSSNNAPQFTLGNSLYPFSFGSTDDDTTYDIAIDTQDSLIAVGVHKANMEVDLGSGTTMLNVTGNRNAFVVKYAKDGTLKWAKTVDGGYSRAYDVVADSADNIYVVGYFDTGSFNGTSLSAQYSDGFVWKLNSEGDTVWLKQLRGTTATSDVWPKGIALDNSGNAYVTGSFIEESDFDPSGSNHLLEPLDNTDNSDYFLLKLDSNGDFLWVKQAGGDDDDNANVVKIDSLGNVYVGGVFDAEEDGMDLDGDKTEDTTITSNVGDGTYSDDNDDVGFVAKYNSSGVHQWTKMFLGATTGDGDNEVTDLAIDDNGNIFATGWFEDDIDFDPAFDATALEDVENNDHAFIVKLDSNGLYQWHKVMGDPSNGDNDDETGVDKIWLASDGSIYLAGDYQTDIDADPGVGTHTLSIGASSQKAFIIKLDNSGDFTWAKSFGSTQPASGDGFAEDSNGNVYMSGDFEGTTDIHPDDYRVINKTSNGGEDIFIVKLTSNGTTTYEYSVTENDSSFSVGFDATDTDGDALSYSLSGADSNKFNIDSSTGILTPIDTPDFEANQSYLLNIVVTDNGGATDTIAIVVNVANVNEAPSIDSAAVTSVNENQEYSYTLTTSDPDGDNLSYTNLTLPSWLSIQKANATFDEFATAEGETYGIAVDNNGNTYFSSRNANKIWKVTPDGTKTRFAGLDAGTAGDGEGLATTTAITKPQGLTYYNGNLYFSEYTGYWKKIDLSTNQITKVYSGRNYYGASIAFDKNGYMYSRGSGTTIYKVTDNNGDGVYDTRETIYNNNSDIGSIDRLKIYNEKLYFVSDSSYALYSLDLDGTNLTLLAGKNGRGKNGDGGDALSAQLYQPLDLDFDSSGNIYIMDRSNGIRKIDINTNIIAKAPNVYSTDRAIALNSDDEIIAPRYSSGFKIFKQTSSGDKLAGTPTVSGVYDISLSVSDGEFSDAQSFQITVNDVNDNPVLNDNAFAVSERASIGTAVGTVTATDEDGVSPSVNLIGSAEVISYSITAGDTNSDFSIDASTGAITTAKTLNAVTKGTYQLTVKAEDDGGASDTAIVAVIVTDLADAPVASNDTATITEDTPSNINVVANDTDNDYNLNNASVRIVSTPSHGSAKANANGTITYTPNADYAGSDSFTYKVYDTVGLESNVATVNITVNNVNDAPVAVAGVWQTDEDVNLNQTIGTLVSDADWFDDLDFTSLSIDVDTQNGTLTYLGDGLIQYEPDANFYGMDSFEFSISDDQAVASNQAKVIINVAPINDMPIGISDSATTNEDTPVTINVIANDTDDSAIDSSSVTILKSPSYGTAVANANGTVTYTPNENWYGIDDFTYRVEDDGTGGGVLSTEPTSVTVNVTSINDIPVAVNDAFTMNEGDVLDMNVDANDIDIEDSSFTIVISSTPTSGTASVNENGLVRYIPNQGYNGTDTFKYTITDSNGGTSSAATVTITIKDRMPDIFNFENVANANRSQLYESTITVTGIDNGTPVRILDGIGQYKINNAEPTNLPSIVNNNDSITFMVTSSSNYSTEVNATLKVGLLSDTFAVITGNIPPPPPAPAPEPVPESDDTDGDGIPDSQEGTEPEISAVQTSINEDGSTTTQIEYADPRTGLIIHTTTVTNDAGVNTPIGMEDGFVLTEAYIDDSGNRVTLNSHLSNNGNLTQTINQPDGSITTVSTDSILKNTSVIITDEWGVRIDASEHGSTFTAILNPDGTIIHRVTTVDENNETVVSEYTVSASDTNTRITKDEITTTLPISKETEFDGTFTIIETIVITDSRGETSSYYRTAIVDNQGNVLSESLSRTVTIETPFEQGNISKMNEDEDQGMYLQVETKITRPLVFE